MKACKSELAKQMQRQGIRIPSKQDSVIAFNGRKYIVKYIPTR